MSAKYITPTYLSWDTLLAKRGLLDKDLNTKNRLAFKRFLDECNKEVDLISSPFTSTRPFVQDTQEFIFAQDLAFSIWILKKEIFDQSDFQLIAEKRKNENGNAAQK